MTREKVRKGIATYLTRQFIWSEPDEMPEDECYEEADHILAYLHSQGLRLPSGESLIKEKE